MIFNMSYFGSTSHPFAYLILHSRESLTNTSKFLSVFDSWCNSNEITFRAASKCHCRNERLSRQNSEIPNFSRITRSASHCCNEKFQKLKGCIRIKKLTYLFAAMEATTEDIQRCKERKQSKKIEFI